MAASAAGKTVPGRKGTCRLCFEEGGEDLIAPCACKGSSKWIHRECLNRWRTTGSNPRSLTNCCECGFQYELDLHRVMDAEGEERRRRFMRRLAGQGFGCLIGTQLAIIAMGMILRAIDQQEILVAIFGFKQDGGQEGLTGDFFNALQHHKTTYYVAGLLALLLFLGVATSFASCFTLCVKEWAAPAPEAFAVPPSVRDHCCTECCCPRRSYGSLHSRCLCLDCLQIAECSADCCHLCSNGECCICGECCRNCSGTCDAKCHGVNNGGDKLGAAIAVIVVVLIVIGLMAAIVATVATIQGALAKLAQLQQMRVLADEYAVRDLAEPSDLGEAPAAPTSQQPRAEEMQGALPGGTLEAPRIASDPQHQQTVQMQISRDIDAIFSGSHVASGALHSRGDQSYGSTAV